MDNLPDYIQLNIYERLDLCDRNKLRLTNKKIKKLIDKIRITDLYICGDLYNGYLNSNAWFFSNELIDQRTIIHIYENERAESRYDRILFPNFIHPTLQRLKITFPLNCEFFNLNMFSKFSSLEQLEFNLENKSYRRYHTSIELNELRNLFIYSCKTLNCSNQQNLINIIIDSPKLENCFFGDNVINCIELIHSSSVKYLEYSDVIYSNTINLSNSQETFSYQQNFQQINSNLVNLDILKRFINVKILKYNSMLNLNDNHLLTILTNLPNLKEIHFSINGLFIMNMSLLRLNDCSKLRFLFNYIQNQIKILRRLDLKIYIQGIHIYGNRSFDDYGFNLQSIFNVHCLNLINLELNFPYIHYLNYNSLLRSINNLPSTQFVINIFDFNVKYCNLKKIDILQPVNQQQFIQFINRCTKLNHLNLNRSLFDQTFFDQLSKLQFDLYILEFKSEPLIIDIDFLSELEYLHYFQTDQKIQTHNIINSIRKLKYFRKAIFCDLDNINIMILSKVNQSCIHVNWKLI